MSGTQKDKVAIENAVRAAAKAAAQGVPLGESVLAKIVAETSAEGLSIADRVARATSLATQYAVSPKPLNEISASPAQLAIQASQAGFKGRFLIDGVTGYGGRDARNSDTKDRRSSAEYDKLAGGAVDRATMTTLLADGFTRQQIADAALTAQTLGWNDRQSIKNLTYAGKEFTTLAEQYEQARRDGDAARMKEVMDRMREERDHAKGNKKKGMTGIIDKFERLHESAPTERLKADHERTTKDTGTRAADAASVFEALKKQQARTKGPTQ